MRVEEPLARRIKAAIALAGMSGIPDLAKQLPSGLRLGQDTLYETLAGKRDLKDHEYDAIVAVCREQGVPPSFFTFDLGTLDDPPVNAIDARFERIEARHDALEDRVNAIADLVASLSRRIDQRPPRPERSDESQPGGT